MVNLILTLSFTILVAAFAISLSRLLKGPHAIDRILCLDLLALVAAGLISVHSVQAHQSAFLDIVLILSITGFIGTIVFARFIVSRRE